MTAPLVLILAFAGGDYTSENAATGVQAPFGEADDGRFEPGTVAASAAAELEPLDAKVLRELGKYVGTVKAVRGTVSGVFAPNGGKVVILNFDRNYRSAMTSPIFSDDFDKWPGGAATVERAYKGKTVLIRGLVTEYRGSAQVKISHPGQIQVIE